MAIFDVLKTAAKVAQEAGKIELYGQILEVYEKLLEQQKKIDELERENKTLSEKLEIKENLVYENNAYWMIRNGQKEGPFCTVCWDADKRAVRLHPDGNPAYYRCQKCKTDSVVVYPEKDVVAHQFDREEPFDRFSAM